MTTNQPKISENKKGIPLEIPCVSLEELDTCAMLEEN